MTLVVDDESLAVRQFVRECANLPGIAVAGAFESPSAALEFARAHPLDLAVLDIEMPEMNGIDLGEKLRAIQPDLVLIYTTAHERYALDAYKLQAAAYLLKPYNTEDIRKAVRAASLLASGKRKRIFVKTFGTFDVFVDGRPVLFKSSKAKELLALLVDFGGSTVNSRLATTFLWEDRPYDNATQSQYRKITRYLQDTLAGAGIAHLVIGDKFTRAINLGCFDCDSYRLLEGDPEAVREFAGEYMALYSWGENTLARLNHLAGTFGPAR
jgi:two-component SAPR family response regulator